MARATEKPFANYERSSSIASNQAPDVNSVHRELTLLMIAGLIGVTLISTLFVIFYLPIVQIHVFNFGGIYDGQGFYYEENGAYISFFVESFPSDVDNLFSMLAPISYRLKGPNASQTFQRERKLLRV